MKNEKFTPDLESRYQDYYWRNSQPMTATAIRSVFFLMAVFVVAGRLFIGDGPSLLVSLLMVLLFSVPVIAALLISRLPITMRRLQLACAPFVGLWMGVYCGWASTLVPLERAQYSFGLILVMVLAYYALTTLPKWTVVSGGLLMTAGWVVFMWSRGIYPGQRFSQIGVYLGIANLVGLITAHIRNVYYRRIFLLHYFLERERDLNANLVQAMLPGAVAERMRHGEGRIADTYESATVVFLDIVGFSGWANRVGQDRVVRLLNDLFSRFDALVQDAGLEKVKTIGDAYMFVAGCPVPNARHAAVAAETALKMLAVAREVFNREGARLDLRVGLNSGPVVGGVIGSIRPQFDIWGDTVNLASRLEASGRPGAIQVSETSWALLALDYRFSEPAIVDMKGFGSVKAHFLIEPRRSMAASRQTAVSSAA